MKIGILSTHPPQHCGIGTYTEALSKALSEVCDVSVLCEKGGEQAHPDVDCVTTFSRHGNYVNNVVSTAKSLNLDILHIQHAPDIFGMDLRVPRLLFKLKEAGIASVITLHTVYDLVSGTVERKPYAPIFHFLTGLQADAIIIHQPSTKKTLLRHGIPKSRLHTIPHGTDIMPQGNPDMIKKRLGLKKDDKILLFFGFVHIQKNVSLLIRAMPQVVAALPETRLLIAGEIAGNTWYNRLYLEYLKHITRQLNLTKNVIFDLRYIPGNEIPDYYATADIAMHPHLQGYGSASGAAHLAIAADVPLLCSDIPKFEDVKEYISPKLMLPPHNPVKWADATINLLTDSAFRNDILSAQKAYKELTSWPSVAKSHLKVYQEAMDRM